MTLLGTTENKPVKAQQFSSITALPTAATYGVGLAMVGQSVYFSDGVTWTNDVGLSVKPLLGIWYVNTAATVNGNGSPAAPFNLLQTAIDSATAYDTIRVTSHGVHAENITMRDLEGISIIGDSEINTKIQNSGNSHTFTWIPGAVTGAAVSSFTATNINFINTDATGTYHAVHIDANAVVSPDTFCSDEMDLNFIDIDSGGTAGLTAAYFRNVGTVYWTHGQVSGGDLVATNCTKFRTRQVEIGTQAAPCNLNVEYAGANAHNGTGRSDYTLAQQSVIWGDLLLQGHPIVQLYTSSLVVGNVSGTLTSFYASGRDYCPVFAFYGQHGLVGGAGGAITLVFPDPQTSGTAFNFVDFGPGAHIEGALTLTKTNFLPATARGIAVVQSSGAHDLATAGAITANGYVALNLRGARYDQAALAVTGAATIDRDVITFVQTTASSPTSVTITPPLPSTATYTVAVSPSVAATFGVTSKTSTGFTLTGPASGTADITINRI